MTNHEHESRIESRGTNEDRFLDALEIACFHARRVLEKGQDRAINDAARIVIRITEELWPEEPDE